MWRRCRFTEGSSLKDCLLWVFVTCVAPIVEEHDIGLCRVTDILNAIYVAETGYVRARVRIFVSLREYTLLLCVLACATNDEKSAAPDTRALLCAHSSCTTTKLAWIFLFLLSFYAFSFFLFFRRVSPLNVSPLSIFFQLLIHDLHLFSQCSTEKYFNLFVINNSRVMRVSKFFLQRNIK